MPAAVPRCAAARRWSQVQSTSRPSNDRSEFKASPPGGLRLALTGFPIEGKDPSLTRRVSTSPAALRVDLRSYGATSHPRPRANRIIAARVLSGAPACWPVERWPNWRFHDVRRVVLHVISETACHAGHLDATRELIDGRTWLVVTG